MNHVAPIAADELANVEQQLEQHALNVERIQGNAVFEIGRELKQAQSIFRFSRDEGGFTGWLAKRLPHINQRAAYRAIQTFEGVEEFDNFVKLSGSALREAATAQPDVQALIAERVQAGEVFTAAQVKDLKRESAEKAIADLHESAEASRTELDAARRELAQSAQKTASEKADLERQVRDLTARVSGFERQVAEFKKDRPKPAVAKKEAAETGGVVLGSDGKFHSGSSIEQKRMVDAFMFVFDRTLDLTDNPPSAERVVAGCAEHDRKLLSDRCEAAARYLDSIRSKINAQ